MLETPVEHLLGITERNTVVSLRRQPIARVVDGYSHGLLKHQIVRTNGIILTAKHAQAFLTEYLEDYDLYAYDPLTHGCQWDSNFYQVIMRRPTIFKRSRWHRDGPSLHAFWHKAGFAPIEFLTYERSRPFVKKVPYFKPPAAAKLFVGDDPVAAARDAHTAARERPLAAVHRATGTSARQR